MVGLIAQCALWFDIVEGMRSTFIISTAKRLLHVVFGCGFYLGRSCQKATAAAAATLSESTLCDMGMRAT